MITFNLPFIGFYNAHDAIIQEYIDREIEDGYLPENFDSSKMDWQAVFTEFAKGLVELANGTILDFENISADIQFVELISPKDYSYGTDVIKVRAKKDYSELIEHIINEHYDGSELNYTEWADDGGMLLSKSVCACDYYLAESNKHFDAKEA